MHDILFTLPNPFTGGSLPLHSYGVMAMLGFLAAVLLARWRAARSAISPDLVTDVAVWGLLAGIVGSRLAYLIRYPDEFNGLADFFKIWQGGLVFFGGLIAAVATILGYLCWKKQRILPVLDVLAPALALGHAFGRVGCVLHGCCYGVVLKNQQAWYGLTYPDGSPPCSVAPAGTRFLPIQLIESANLLAVFVILTLFFKRRKAAGQVTALYLVLYALARFVDEFWRGDAKDPSALSTAQWISVALFFAGLLLWGLAADKIDSAPQAAQGASKDCQKGRK
jgi:phosphatidylglycerol:prolipoprotein diacylglycerol transferase